MTATPTSTAGADPLTESVRSLTRTALQRANDVRAEAELTDALNRLSQPLRLAIAGRVKAGKSTLLNALLGEELAPTDAGECTRLVTWYIGSDRPAVIVHHRDGRSVQRPFSRQAGALEVDLGAPLQQVDHLEVCWPSSRLRDVTLIDTPGIASLSSEISDRASALLTVHDDRPPLVDAVLYLLRHTHASDVRFLEAFHDDELGRGTPMNAVGVLARADEIGSCRLDALQVAARVADRYQHDQRIRRLCPLVIPVAGLIGQAGTTLREPEFAALGRIAALPIAAIESLLLTADRLTRDDVGSDVTELERRHLIDRLGLFGVRLSVTLIRSGEVRSATELAARLTGSSGLDTLRGVLLQQFTQRSQVLRARSALAILNSVIRRGAVDQPALLEAAVEEVASSAHEFVELRLLNDLRSDAVQVPDRLQDEAYRLLGGFGHSPAARLGLGVGPADHAGSGSAEVRTAALAALSRWQKVAASPLASRPVQLAARVMIRTIEGILAAQ